MKIRRRRVNKSAVIMAIPSIFFLFLSIFGFSASIKAATIPDAGFEDGTFTGWDRGAQTGTLGSTITGTGTGVTIFTGPRTFTHGARGARGTSTSPYYSAAVPAGSWTFSPNNGTNAVLLQPRGAQTFSQATTALDLSAGAVTEIRSTLSSQAQASGNGSGNPTDASWITRTVELTAGVTYTMAWNYVGTDYVPYNDGSITSLVPVTVSGTPVVTVNNYVKSYAFLGFTNPGTGDYSTNSYGSTGWQTSTYQVSISGTYKLGFTVFNLDDQSLSPALMVDSEVGSTERCVSGTCTTFGGVVSNSPTAPTVAPTTTTASTTTTTSTTTTVPAATSLVVTSLDDTTSNGTLRWAVTQANATSGGIYDSITFGVSGTITLTSALPQITENLAVTGNGRTQTIIDGNNLHRPFNIASTKSLTISNMTLKNGQATNGGLIYNGSGTLSATDIRFTGMSGGSAVFNNNNGSVSTLTNVTFDYNNIGIAGDYGSTPTALSQTDADYTNRTYVYDSVFSNNTYGISGERFFKINNTQFSNNTYAAVLAGLNRQQVTNSVFTSNGTAVYLSSGIPTSWTPGAGNQTVSGNTFNGNTTALAFANNWVGGSLVYNGISANSFSTSSSNTFGAVALNTTNYLGSGYTTIGDTVSSPPTTTIATTTSTSPTPVVQIVVPIEVPSVTTAPSLVVTEPVLVVPTGTTLPPPVTESTLTTSPVVATEPALGTDKPQRTETTSILLPVIPDGTIVKPTSPNTTVKITETTAVKTTETTIVTSSKVKTVTSDILDTNATPQEVDKALDKVLDSNFTDTQLAQVVGSVFSDITKTEQVTALVANFLEKDLSTKELTTVMGAVFNDGATVSQMSAVVDDLLKQDLSTEELTAVFDAAFDDDLSDKETIDLIVDVLKDGLDAETLGVALGAVFDKEVSTEVLVQTFTAVLGNELNKESIGIIVGVLDSNTITSQQVAQVITLIIQQEGGIRSDQATELATSAKVLESVDGAQATEVFSALVVPEISSENGLAIVGAIQEAPVEVKESFEKELNVFAGVFDTYIPLDSSIDVGTRRSVIAVNLVTSTVAIASAAGGIPTSGSKPDPSGPRQDIAARKEEDEEEEGGSIEGEGPDWIKQISIYKYKDGVKVLDWKNFTKKFIYGVMSFGFTIAGAVIMYFTLSGLTQQIALWGTAIAFACAMYLHMKEPD